MARINKGALSRLEIIREASRQFLEKGYSSTTVTAIAKALEMSPGNLTFYFPTKEHLLAELVEALCSFLWKMMEEEANEGYSSVMAICLELTSVYWNEADGSYLYSEVFSTSLRQVAQAADAQWATLDSTQKTAFTAMYQKFLPVMENWNLPNTKEN